MNCYAFEKFWIGQICLSAAFSSYIFPHKEIIVPLILFLQGFSPSQGLGMIITKLHTPYVYNDCFQGICFRGVDFGCLTNSCASFSIFLLLTRVQAAFCGCVLMLLPAVQLQVLPALTVANNLGWCGCATFKGLCFLLSRLLNTGAPGEFQNPLHHGKLFLFAALCVLTGMRAETAQARARFSRKITPYSRQKEPRHTATFYYF